MNLFFFDEEGNCKSLINKDLNSEASFIKEKLKDTNYRNFIDKLNRKKLSFQNLKSFNCFNKDSMGGDEFKFTVEGV